MGVGSDLYTGAASFGRTMTFITAVVSTIVAIILIIAGVIIYTRKNTRTAYPASVLYTNGPNGICPQNASCILTVKYSGSPDPVDINYTNTGHVYYDGEMITIYVDNTNPLDATLNKPLSKKAGLFIIVAAIFLAGMGWFWYEMSKKYKFLAAAEGGSEALRMFRI